jgi:hypothetical protein
MQGNLLRGKLALGTTISIFGELGCKDPRYRIYAMLGRLSDAEQLGIVPNYQISANKLLVQVSKRIYLAYQNLIFLSNIGSTDTFFDLSLPSWALRPAPDTEVVFSSSRPHPSSKNTIIFDVENTVMTVQGRIVDKVEIVIPPSTFQ